MITDYEHLATGRKTSMFRQDVQAHRDALDTAIRGSRIAIVGAAGSIGFSVVKSLLPYGPAGLTLIDLSENNLVEVVRELRSSPDLIVPMDFEALPLGLGSSECTRFFRESEPFEYILNLSAIKHVRSEKDVYCLSRMFDTNVIFLHELLDGLPYVPKKVFSVSSDKAANPANLMGASKMVMEEMLRSQDKPFSTARFANVAFSDGSLLHGFLQRIAKRQPLSAPSDVKRYFMSHEEAGQICVLSCVLGTYGDVFYPRLESHLNERTFSAIAGELLVQLGYEPVECGTESEARSKVADLISKGKWPCFFFKSDTTGEKAFEEFYSKGETIDDTTYRNIGVVKRDPADAQKRQSIIEFLRFVREAKHDREITKPDYVAAVSSVVPGLAHVETGKNLDQKM